MRIYVATSWRNPRHAEVMAALRAVGHAVYDFKNAKSAFAWLDVTEKPVSKWTMGDFAEAVHDPLAEKALRSDFRAMKDCDVLVMVQPCGRSAHLELGIGANKRTFVLLADFQEPEVTLGLADGLCVSIEDLVRSIGDDPGPYSTLP